MNALLVKSMSVWDGSRSIETNHLLRLNAEETNFSWGTSPNSVLGTRSPDEIKLPELEEMASKTDQSLTFMGKLITNPAVVKLIFSTWSLWDCTGHLLNPLILQRRSLQLLEMHWFLLPCDGGRMGMQAPKLSWALFIVSPGAHISHICCWNLMGWYKQ